MISSPLKSQVVKLSVEVWQEDGGWIASGTLGDKATIVTQGCTEEELWDMLADACMTVRDVEVGWWNRLLFRLRWYGWKHFKNQVL